MPVTEQRKKEIKDCADEAISSIKKSTELSFNDDEHHKSGRSGNHGKKFNRIAVAIIHCKNNPRCLADHGCFTNDEEKKLVIQEFEKRSKAYHKKAKAINHKQ